MEQLWERIESWLQKNASEMLSTLRPPATDQQIQAVEQAMNLTMPEDFKRFYRVHNGQYWVGQSGRLQNFAEEWSLLSLEGIFEDWKSWRDLYADGTIDDEDPSWQALPQGPIRKAWFHPAWIPFQSSGSGDFYCLDLAPAEGGNVGQVILTWHDADERTFLAVSFREWLQGFADALEAGEYVFSKEVCDLVFRRPVDYDAPSPASVWVSPQRELLPVYDADVLRRAYAGGRRDCSEASLASAALAGVDLEGINLSRSDLRGSDLRETRLGGAALTEADLRGANLAGAWLSRAGLWGVDAREADLTGAHLDGSILVEANLWRARLRGAGLRGANLRRANLQEADLQESRFLRADLTGADLRGASLLGASLDEDGLRGADLRGATMPDGTIHS